MQLLMSEGNEFNKTKGLNIVNGTVDSMNEKNGIKVPHVGWNNFENFEDIQIFSDIDIKSNFYFVHSFTVNTEDKEIKSMKFNYSGKEFIGAFQKKKYFWSSISSRKKSRTRFKTSKKFF